MSEMLYLQTEKNVKITRPDVHLQDIARLSCSNPKVLSRNQVLKVLSVPKHGYGRYVVSAMDIIELIQKREEHVDVTHIGEASFVLTYEKPSGNSVAWSIIKTAFVCLVTFFGTGFAIMTFNNDANVHKLFTDIHEQLTGQAHSGFSVLEISYSIGIAVGVVFFFNHFGRRKLTQDPTPMEVEMRIYEDEVDSTIKEQVRREE